MVEYQGSDKSVLQVVFSVIGKERRIREDMFGSGILLQKVEIFVDDLLNSMIERMIGLCELAMVFCSYLIRLSRCTTLGDVVDFAQGVVRDCFRIMIFTEKSSHFICFDLEVIVTRTDAAETA